MESGMDGREETGTTMNLVSGEDIERGGWPCMPCMPNGHRNGKATVRLSRGMTVG